MTKIALVDDHALLRNGLANVISSFGSYQVIFEADNGRDFIDSLKIKGKPDIVLLDINMPVMDGFETANWIKNNAPEIKMLVLSMLDSDKAIIQMLQHGAKGYILKDSKPTLLRSALRDISEKGFFFNDLVSSKLVNIVKKDAVPEMPHILLSEREIEFIRLCSTEKSYKEIADVLGISNRTVETLRSNVFEKIDTLSRVGLVMYGIKNGIISV